MWLVVSCMNRDDIMASTTTTVVTKQVTSSSAIVGSGGTTVITGNRDWNESLLGCCSDCKSLLCTLFCLPCFAGQLSQRMGEHCCLPCVMPGGLIAMRAKVRYMLGIQGSLCNDCLVFTCCGLCSVCQMSRELDAAGWPQ